MSEYAIIDMNKKHSPSECDVISQYQSRIHDLKHILSTESNDKNSVLTRAIHFNDFDRVQITKFCQEAINKTGNADFDMICLIRLLYYNNTPKEIKNEIIDAFIDFPFWPHSAKDGERLKKVVFWSENHAFMLLSSGYLYRQYLLINKDDRYYSIHPTELEYQLLTCSLKAHLEATQPGLYEVLSFVYLPYTLMSLINIIEYSLDTHLIDYSKRLADMVVHQMMSVTTKSGVCSIAVAARTYKRFRLRTFGHNVNHFIYCMTGRHPDKKHTDVVVDTEPHPGFSSSSNTQPNASAGANAEPGVDDEKLPEGEVNEVPHQVTVPGKPDGEYLGSSRIGDFICCVTGYIPSKACFDAFSSNGFTSTIMNPSVSELKAYFDKYVPELTLSAAAAAAGDDFGKCTSWTQEDIISFKRHIIPLYWSAGLLVHPTLAVSTKSYVEYFHLQHNVHLWPLSWVSSGLTDVLSNSYRAWTTGQCYIGIRLNIYKHDELLLTSFEKFNGGTCGYQQLPWIANVDGIGVWTQSGKGSENVGGFDVTNTHTPHVSQKGHILVAAYSTPDSLLSSVGLGALFNTWVRLFWLPSELNDCEERTLEVVNARDKHSKGLMNSFKNLLAPADKVKGGWSAMSWWLAERNDSFIGICCTGETVALSSNSKDAKFELKKGSVVKQRNRTCKDPQHAWICVVGTKSKLTNSNSNSNSDSINTNSNDNVLAASPEASAFPLKCFETFEAFKSYCVNDISIETSSTRPPSQSRNRSTNTSVYSVSVCDRTNSLYDIEVSII